MGLASSEGLGRTAVSGSDFQAADAATAASYLRRTYALSCASPWIRGARPRSRSAQCAMRRMTTSSASLSFSRLGPRTLPPANANGRERCPSRKVFLRATDFASILVASLRCHGYGAGRPTEPQGDLYLASPSDCGLRSEALTCSVPEARRWLARSLVVRPNVRAKRATTAGRQARAGENVPRTARPGLVACRWRSA